MRFMMIITSADTSPPPREMMDAVSRLTEEEIKAGRLVGNGGLLPMPMGGAQVQLKGGQIRTIDGPFVETKEFIGGFAIFELRDMAEALAQAQAFMQLHKDFMPGWEGTCEVRVMFENCAEIHERMRAEVA